MRSTLTVFFIFFHALLSKGTPSSSDDRRWLLSLVDLVELDFEDHCDHRATATWNELIGINKGLSIKLERDKAFGMFARQQTTDVKSALTKHALGAEDDVLRRKVRLLLQPGDTLLSTEQWFKLVTFGDTALHKLRTATDYHCGGNSTCTLNELYKSLPMQEDEATLQKMKQSWEKNLPPLNEYLETILPLLINASKENNYDSVEQYWDALIEYEGAMLKAREIWDSIKPLYTKLHKYVYLKLKGSTENETLPVYLLRSFIGDDWSNIVEKLLPIHPDVYEKIKENLRSKNIGGLKALEVASLLIQDLKLGKLDSHIIKESLFNGTCPATFVDWCKPNKIKVFTCDDVSISNYIDAHEVAMKIKYKQTTALHSNNTYILREASRYSAVYDGISGFASLIALNPHALDKAGLYPLERFNYNPNHHRLVLQLIMALKDLPRLNYYLAADEWRLNVLNGKIPASNIMHSWREFRRNHSWIEISNGDILGDPYVLFNKPLLGKFLGIILKYQIYQSFAEELISDDSNLIQHIGENNDRLSEAMIQGFGVLWPDLVSDLLAKREDGLEYTGCTDYYRLLDEYLDNQLDPSIDSNSIDEYVEPVEPEIDETEDNEIPVSNFETTDEANVQEEPLDHENILDNVINVDENLKFNVETSTVGVLEIKNPVAANDQTQEINTKEASYSTYWWIGIAVGVAIVIIIIAMIARKRHNHRKELEKQRRENSRA